MMLAVGVDVGGTKTVAGLVDETGTVLVRAHAPTPASAGPRAVLDTVIRLAAEVIGSHRDVATIGIGSAGVIDPRSRRVLSATSAMPGWAGTPLGQEVENSLSRPVVVMNDVHAHAWGESWVGAAQGADSAIVITAGTGIGGAFIFNRALWSGTHSVAGHIGHIPCIEAQGLACTCGGTGHVEAIASGPAILAAFLRSADNEDVRDTKSVVALAERGHPLAGEIVTKAATALGRVTGGLMNTLDTDVVVVGGGLASAGKIWWSGLCAGIASETLGSVADCPVRPAMLADSAVIGAAHAALLNMGESHQ